MYEAAHILTVLFQDGRFGVHYLLEPVAHRHLVVMNDEFLPSPESWDGRWRRFRCDLKIPPNGIGPGLARQIIDWCSNPEQTLVKVDWEGRSLDPSGKPEELSSQALL